jgi:hypothetical protein
MITLEIRKKSSAVWWHVFSNNGTVTNIKTSGKFSFSLDGETTVLFSLIEVNQVSTDKVDIDNITIFDDTDSGLQYTFASRLEFELALQNIGYTGYQSGNVPIIENFIPLTGTEVGKPITGAIEFVFDDYGDIQLFYNNGNLVGGISYDDILGMVNVLYKGDNYSYYLQDGIFVSVQTAGSESETKFLFPSTVGFSGNLTFATREWANVNFPKYGTSAPASATATGTTGEIRVTSTYIYWCYATNQWGRAASTW